MRHSVKDKSSMCVHAWVVSLEDVEGGKIVRKRETGSANGGASGWCVTQDAWKIFGRAGQNGRHSMLLIDPR